MYRFLWILLLQLVGTLAQANCSRDIVVPFSQQGVDQWFRAGVRTGLSVAYLEEVSRRTGCQFTYSDVPRARAWWMFERSQADLVLGAVHSARRDLSGEFYDQNVQEVVSLVSLRAQPLNLGSREAILASGLTFSFIRGHDYGPKTEELIGALSALGRVILTKDPNSMLRVLMAGRVNGAIVQGSTITVDSHNLNLDEQLVGIAIEDLGWASGGLYMSKSLPPEDRQLLARTFAQLNEEGFYARLALGQMGTQPAWVQSNIRMEYRFPLKLVEQSAPPAVISWHSEQEATRQAGQNP